MLGDDVEGGDWEEACPVKGVVYMGRDMLRENGHARVFLEDRSAQEEQI